MAAAPQSVAGTDTQSVDQRSTCPLLWNMCIQEPGTLYLLQLSVHGMNARPEKTMSCKVRL